MLKRGNISLKLSNQIVIKNLLLFLQTYFCKKPKRKFLILGFLAFEAVKLMLSQMMIVLMPFFHCKLLLNTKIVLEWCVTSHNTTSS